ncbi:hypothetical protein OAP32_00705 [Crocinitomicaceae bacterium]|nr:hypothetical protein [Crocinitomicaceae bacterium]
MSRVKLGIRRSDGKAIYISDPTWDCGWYWSFGYLGNDDEHYHLENYQSTDHAFKLEDGTFKLLTEKRNINMYDALVADYDLEPNIRTNLWTFCELVLTAYSLKKTAELYGRGGSHMTTNPCKELLTKPDVVTHINDVALPAIFAELTKIYKGEHHG